MCPTASRRSTCPIKPRAVKSGAALAPPTVLPAQTLGSPGLSKIGRHFVERRKQQLVATSIAMVEEVGGARERVGGEGQEAMAVGIAATFREDAIALNVPRHTTVYVGRIPKTYDDERVDRLLGACGRVRSFLRATHPETNAAKHYGFCEYRDGLSCMRAIEVLDGLQGKSPLSPYPERADPGPPPRRC